MIDSVDNLEKRLIDSASQFLLSGEIQKAVKNKRRTVCDLFEEQSLDAKLQNIARSQAENELIPALQKIQPRLEFTLGSRGVNFTENWIHTYIKHAARKKTSNKTLAKSYARKFVKDAISDYYIFKEITPMINFSAEREFSLSNNDINPRVTYRFSKHDFRQHAQALCFHPILFSPQVYCDIADMHPYDWVLIVEQRIPRTKKFVGDVGRRWGFFTNQILDVLRLFKDQEFRTINSYRSLSSFLFAGRSFVFRGDSFAEPTGQDYYLSEAEIKTFGKYWRKTKKYIPFDKKLPSNLEMAIRYFRASEKKPLHERFLDLAISLEALFFIASENTYRLPIRVSTFLHGHNKEAKVIFEEVRKFWTIRNLIAHGDFNVKNQTKWKQLQQITPSLRSVVRRSINKHLELFSKLNNQQEEYIRFMKQDFEKKYVVGNG